MTDTMAPAGGGQGTQTDTTGQNTTPPWYGEIADQEMKGWVENKGFKSPAEALTSYRNLEKAFGADKAGRTVLLPGANADEAEMGAFFNKLGRPETADKYELQAPETADKGFLDWAKGTFYKAGLSGKQAQQVLAAYQEFAGGRADQLSTEAQNRITADNEALQREWGAAHPQKLAQAKAAARQFGFTAEEVDALEKQVGFAGVMKRFADIGAKLGEGGLAISETSGNGFAMTPAQASAKIAELQSDKAWLSMYLSGSASHREQMDNLQKMAAASGKR